MKVVGHESTLDMVLTHLPECDVILVGPTFPHDDILQFIETWDRQNVAANILVLGTSIHEKENLPYLEASAIGYVMENDSVEILLSKVRSAHKGRALIS